VYCSEPSLRVIKLKPAPSDDADVPAGAVYGGQMPVQPLAVVQFDVFAVSAPKV
jgi:hypothetical protein